jgi:hypothetical protein
MLKPLRQQDALNIDFCGFDTSDRGGILHITSVSGMDLARYVDDPSGMVPLGFQFNDIEYIDRTRQPDPRRNREVADPFEVVGIFTDGDAETDWVHLLGSPTRGAPAYAGPSGTVTDSASFGGAQIGVFLGPLNPNPHLVTYRGRGFTTSFQEPCTHNIIVDNDPEDRVLVLSDGSIRVRITQGHIIRNR